MIQTRRKGNRNILTGKECEMQETDVRRIGGEE